MKTSGFENKRILITVKAYPAPSISYGETVCCAGLDIDRLRWVRLYPIPFRDLDSDKQFKKYSIIEAKCRKADNDLRPESYRIQSESIKILEYLGTDDRWEKRKNAVLRSTITTFCQIIEDQKVKNTSLGLIKPKDVSFEFKKRPPEDIKKRTRAYAQPGIFDKQKEEIEEIPFHFYYRFRCVSESNCPGHNLSIIDWEINQAFRTWRVKYQDEKVLLRKIEEKWLRIADPTRSDVYFYVGNLHRFQNVFTVLGVFYPPLLK